MRRVREQAPDLPIVILTGLNDDGAVRQMLDAGAQGYLLKGRLDGAALLRILREAVARQQARKDFA